MDLVEGGMPEQMYAWAGLRLVATVQGACAGLQSKDCGTWRGQEDAIELESCSLGVSRALAETPNGMTGHVRLEPVVLVKPLNASSPLLLRALTTNEELTVVLRVYRTRSVGERKWELVFTFHLERATLLGYSLYLPLDGHASSIAERLELQVGTYWGTYEPSGISYFEPELINPFDEVS